DLTFKYTSKRGNIEDVEDRKNNTEDFEDNENDFKNTKDNKDYAKNSKDGKDCIKNLEEGDEYDSKKFSMSFEVESKKDFSLFEFNSYKIRESK
ncbi:21412_t:CDS:2, partial [Dentiscutata erythropus]